MFENVSEIAVLVSSLLAVAVGSIWYSPLVFGKYWMDAIGLTEADITTPRKQVVKLFVFGFLAHTVLLYVLARFVAFAVDAGESVWRFAFLITVLLCATLGISAVWEQRSLMYFCINACYTAIVVYGGVAILAYWPW